VNNLPDRMTILKNTPLYKGGDLLIDVGCATGYFEVALNHKYKKIIAFTPEEWEYKKAKKEVSRFNNVYLYHSSFGNFDFKDLQADVVYLGNCIHYIFQEYKGFDFVPQLIKISKKYLIIEYPYDINLDASDMKVLKGALQAKGIDELFTKENILKQLKTEFDLIDTLKSGSTTREILIWKRK